MLNKAVLKGFFAGLIGSLCCLGPTILLLLGLGAFFGITSACYKEYRPLFALIAIMFFAISMFIYFKKDKNACNYNNKRKTKIILIGLVVAIIVYVIALFVILPYLQERFLSQASCHI